MIAPVSKLALLTWCIAQGCSGTLAERNQVHQMICKFITPQGIWEKGNPNDLKFRSKRQLKALKGLGSGPLSGHDKKLLGITSPPREPILLACAKGCATLIRSGNIAKPAGKKEAQIIIEAAANADPQLGKTLNAAVESAAAGATKGTSPEPRGPGTPFATIDEAAIDGLLYCARENRRNRDNFERGYDIRPDGDNFAYADITIGNDDNVPVNVDKNLTVAWFHTHPPKSPRGESFNDIANRQFSEKDDAQSRAIKEFTGREPFAYIGGTDGSIRKKGPGIGSRGIVLRSRFFLKYTG